jgi:hydroxymethylbilane synthase
MSTSVLGLPRRRPDYVGSTLPAYGLETTLRAGTRGSPLALTQTRAVMELLTRTRPAPTVKLEIIRTTGDVVQSRRLADIGGKGLFSKEIHEALLDERIDFAVHSLKDLETQLPPNIVLACTLPREDARDALIIAADVPVPSGRNPYETLPPGALVGSSSVRRQAQLLAVRPDLRVETIRGNVETRLAKLGRHSFAATFLAMAGLRRLNRLSAASVILDPAVMVPASGQGIVGVTVRADDTRLRDLLGRISDRQAELAATAERAVLQALDGSCQTPIGAYARFVHDGYLHLTALVARTDGSFLLRRELTGRAVDAMRLGTELGASLRRDSPRDIFA